MREVVIKVQGCRDKTIVYEFIDPQSVKFEIIKKILPPKTNIKSLLTEDKKIKFPNIMGEDY